MATLLELRSLLRDNVLHQRVEAAVLVAANAIRIELATVPNHANRLVWAKQGFANPVGKVEGMLSAVLAANSTATVAEIQGATDAIVQSNVNAAVNLFADGTV